MNPGAWATLATIPAEAPAAGPAQEDDGQEDAMWSSFKTKAELQQQQKVPAR